MPANRCQLNSCDSLMRGPGAACSGDRVKRSRGEGQGGGEGSVGCCPGTSPTAIIGAPLMFFSVLGFCVVFY